MVSGGRRTLCPVQQVIGRTTARGGESIAYATVGDGPLLVLAAWWTSHLELDWHDDGLRCFVETLGQRHTVVRYDRPGVGMSDRGARPYDLDAEVDYLTAVIDSVTDGRRDRPVDLVGISCGGPASIRVAAQRPEQIRRLVLFASYACGSEITDVPTRDALTALVRANWGMGSQTLTSIFLPDADRATARGFDRAQRDTASADVAADLLDLTFRLDASEHLPELDLPVLVLHRSHDRVIEARLGRELAERISGAEYRELEGRAHVPWSGDGEQAVDAITDFLTGQKPAGAVRRRLATVCFVDIVDSTVVLRSIGDARWSARMDRFHALVSEEAATRGGVVVKDTGDGALSTFDLPGAALEFCRALRRRTRGLDLTLRSGVHTGEVEQRDDDIAGLTVVVASRVCSAAAPDQILATRTVAELAAGGSHRFVDVGLHDLKGIAGRVELVDVDPAERSDGDGDGAAQRPDRDGDDDDDDRLTCYRFGACELDVVAFELRRDGRAVAVEPQVLEVLLHLVEHAGELVSKQQLLDEVWGHRFASESTLSSRIRSVRQAIGDDGRRQELIKTVHGRGFRFVAEVHAA